MEKYSFKINGHDYEVEVGPVTVGNAHVKVNGTEYDVAIEYDDGTVPGAEPSAAAERNPEGLNPTGLNAGGQTASGAAGNAGSVGKAGRVGNAGNGSGPKQAASVAAQGGETVTAPLPGVIVDMKVKVGDSVKAGQTVAVLEAMKMENEIEAPVGGTVTAVNAAKGDSVLEGAAIVTIG